MTRTWGPLPVVRPTRPHHPWTAEGRRTAAVVVAGGSRGERPALRRSATADMSLTISMGAVAKDVTNAGSAARHEYRSGSRAVMSHQYNEMTTFEPYDGLSSDEVKLFQDFTKWSSARVADCHQSLIRLVDKVRARCEAYVDQQQDNPNWVPPMDWTLVYKTTVDGGAKLISEYYRRQAKNPAMGLTDEQLEQELQKAALALVDSLPLDEMERLVRRRKYVEAHGEERKPPETRPGPTKMLREGR